MRKIYALMVLLFAVLQLPAQVLVQGDEFPEEFNAYLTFLEEQLGVEIKIVSVGPDRAQTIERYTEE